MGPAASKRHDDGRVSLRAVYPAAVALLIPLAAFAQAPQGGDAGPIATAPAEPPSATTAPAVQLPPIVTTPEPATPAPAAPGRGRRASPAPTEAAAPPPAPAEPAAAAPAATADAAPPPAAPPPPPPPPAPPPPPRPVTQAERAAFMAWGWGAAEGWTFIGGAGDTGVFLRPAVATEGGLERITVRMEHYPGAGPLTAGQPASSILLEEVDCAARRSRVIVSEHFAGPNGTGASLGHEASGDAVDWTQPAPGTMADRLVSAACAAAGQTAAAPAGQTP